MEVIRLSTLAGLLILSGCQGAGNPADNNVPQKWDFNFFTPKALPSMVTFVVVIDANDRVSRFVRLNSTPALGKVIGEWNDRSRAPSGYWNHVKHPPKQMFFCWDSVIDKRVYETRLTLSDAVVEKMRRPSVYKDYLGRTAYYDNLQIGLAPEGKVAVWLQGIGFEPNYRVTPSVLKTVSGEQMVLCRGVTRHPNGYKYYGDTPEFIKGKVYPYGNW